MREESAREGVGERDWSSLRCDAGKESEGRMKGKVKRRQVEARAALGKKLP